MMELPKRHATSLYNRNGLHSKNIGSIQKSSFLSGVPIIIGPSKNKTLKLTKVLSESDVYFNFTAAGSHPYY